MSNRKLCCLRKAVGLLSSLYASRYLLPSISRTVQAASINEVPHFVDAVKEVSSTDTLALHHLGDPTYLPATDRFEASGLLRPTWHSDRAPELYERPQGHQDHVEILSDSLKGMLGSIAAAHYPAEASVIPEILEEKTLVQMAQMSSWEELQGAYSFLGHPRFSTIRDRLLEALDIGYGKLENLQKQTMSARQVYISQKWLYEELKLRTSATLVRYLQVSELDRAALKILPKGVSSSSKNVYINLFREAKQKVQPKGHSGLRMGSGSRVVSSPTMMGSDENRFTQLTRQVSGITEDQQSALLELSRVEGNNIDTTVRERKLLERIGRGNKDALSPEEIEVIEDISRDTGYLRHRSMLTALEEHLSKVTISHDESDMRRMRLVLWELYDDLAQARPFSTEKANLIHALKNIQSYPRDLAKLTKQQALVFKRLAQNKAAKKLLDEAETIYKYLKFLPVKERDDSESQLLEKLESTLGHESGSLFQENYEFSPAHLLKIERLKQYTADDRISLSGLSKGLQKTFNKMKLYSARSDPEYLEMAQNSIYFPNHTGDRSGHADSRVAISSIPLKELSSPDIEIVRNLSKGEMNKLIELTLSSDSATGKEEQRTREIVHILISALRREELRESGVVDRVPRYMQQAVDLEAAELERTEAAIENIMKERAEFQKLVETKFPGLSSLIPQEHKGFVELEMIELQRSGPRLNNHYVSL